MAFPQPLPPAPITFSSVSRRKFLVTSAGSFATGVLAAAPRPVGGPGRRSAVFQHGVASGDPLPDGVILWTRVTPSAEAMPGSGLGEMVVVGWEISKDPGFTVIMASGSVLTGPERDHTVKVDVRSLAPATTYYYRFTYPGSRPSLVGRTCTAPAYDADVASIRFGLASCANFEAGFFSAYGHMARRNDLDFVLHVGDYLYEYATGVYGLGEAIGRVHDPVTEMVTLSDYRRRHAQYKADADLRALHASVPFICTWDDHELTNDAYAEGAENHQPATEGDFGVRRANSYRAYFEWMPIRLPDPTQTPSRIYRQFQFGKLADLSMLDLRQYRDKQPLNGADLVKDDAERVILGREQLDWLKANLSASATQWKLVGNSVMISPVDFRNPQVPPQVLAALGLMAGVPFNVDSWDGYTDDRRELLQHLVENGINNVAFLTGDIHSSWACDVPRDPVEYLKGQPPVAIELVGTSITSDNLNEIFNVPPRSPLSLQVEGLFKAANPHVKLLEFDSHGYSVVDVTPDRLQMDWHYISERTDPLSTESFGAAVQCQAGTNRLTPAPGPLGPRV